MEGNGIAPDFTHTLTPFTLNGFTFQRKKVPARDWAETLARVGAQEREEMAKTEGSVLFAVSGDGMRALVRLAVRTEDLPEFDRQWEEGLLEFGELAALKDWLWEQMTERPFMSDTPSSDGPGSSSDPSSRDESPSQVEVLTG